MTITLNELKAVVVEVEKREENMRGIVDQQINNYFGLLTEMPNLKKQLIDVQNTITAKGLDIGKKNAEKNECINLQNFFLNRHMEEQSKQVSDLLGNINNELDVLKSELAQVKSSRDKVKGSLASVETMRNGIMSLIEEEMAKGNSFVSKEYHGFMKHMAKGGAQLNGTQVQEEKPEAFKVSLGSVAKMKKSSKK